MQYPAREPVQRAGHSEGWKRLAKIGPGRNAVVTLTDGTLRGGWIAGVDAELLRLQSAGKTLELLPGSIATVRVKRPDRTLLGSVIGFMITGGALTAIAYSDGDYETEDLFIMFGVAGIPGGLIGAWIGDRRGGDVEIVP